MTEVLENVQPKNTAQVIDDDKNTQLHYSAASGKLDDVKKDLETHKKIDVENYLGWTPLMMACRNGHLDVVNLLLEKRADATRKNKFGFTIFLVCVASGKLELITVILQHLLCGGVSRQSMQTVFSPISLAILFRHHKIVDYLIEHSFDINCATHSTEITPLMFAAALDSHQDYTALLKKKADSSKKNVKGATAQDLLPSKQEKVIEPKPVKAEIQQEPIVETVDNNLPYIEENSIPYQIPNQQFHHSHPQNHHPQVPMIFYNQAPYYPIAPVNSVMNYHLRKSSNILTPNYVMSPNITPITPVFMPQMFFPPDFSPGQVMSPMAGMYGATSEFLNYRIDENGFMAAIPHHHHVHYPSPCV